MHNRHTINMGKLTDGRTDRNSHADPDRSGWGYGGIYQYIHCVNTQAYFVM